MKKLNHILLDKVFVIFCMCFCSTCFSQSAFKTFNTDSLNPTYVLVDTLKYPWLAGAEVIGLNVITNRFNYYTNPADFSTVGFNTWQDNLQHGLTWDWNNFAVNHFGHPYQGAHYYNSARSTGMNYWVSGAYTFLGSATWEYFGETHPPSGNDLINTTMGGMFLGEMMYRLSDLILDGRAIGFERVTREFFGFVVNPMRGFNRLLTGKMKQYDLGGGYIKPRMHGSFSYGDNLLSQELGISTPNKGGLIEADFTYGDPFDERTTRKKPFDFFNIEAWYRVRRDSTKTRHLSITGYGNVMLKDVSNLESNNKHVFGVFHTYDYLNGGLIEIGSMGVSPGLLSKFYLTDKVTLTTRAIVGPIVLGGSNSEVVNVEEFSDDTTDTRDYILGPGVETRLEARLEAQKWGTFTVKAYRWNIYVASGPAGRERLNALSIKYEVPLYKWLYIGGRYVYYDRKATYDDYDDINKNLDEVRTFLTYRF